MYRAPKKVEESIKKVDLESEIDVNSIHKMTQSEGWQNVAKWIKNRIFLSQNKIVNAESDINIEKVETKTKGKIEITVVNINKDYAKHEIQAFTLLLKKIEDWNNMIKEMNK